MTPAGFVATLKGLDFENTFNPYSHCCAVHDHERASRRRVDMLRAILEVAIRTEIDSLWIGRDLGYRGGRRTGLALTDDVHVEAHARRWRVVSEAPTIGKRVKERTAIVIWSVLDQLDAKIFLWNVFPLHPHKPGDPFTNRAHNSQERRVGEELLVELLYMLRPRRIVPIGNSAVSTVHRLCGSDYVFPVRHPSYGGQNEFRKQICELYQSL